MKVISGPSRLPSIVLHLLAGQEPKTAVSEEEKQAQVSLRAGGRRGGCGGRRACACAARVHVCMLSVVLVWLAGCEDPTVTDFCLTIVRFFLPPISPSFIVSHL